MPGAAGNFLTRLCEQADQPNLIRAALYPPEFGATQRQPDPVSQSWLRQEQEWNRRPYPRFYHGHSDSGRAWYSGWVWGLKPPAHFRPDPVWLRVTVTIEPEWSWAVLNALWKDSIITDKMVQASSPALPAQYHIPLRATWHWPTLASALESCHIAINPHQHTLWQSWRATWFPAHLQETAEWQKQIRALDPVRPRWI
jgi:hypothetical protein